MKSETDMNVLERENVLSQMIDKEYVYLKEILAKPYHEQMTSLIELHIRGLEEMEKATENRVLKEKIWAIVSEICNACFNLPKSYPNYLLLLLKAAEWQYIRDDNKAALEFYAAAFVVAKTVSSDELSALEFITNGDTWSDSESYEKLKLRKDCYRIAYKLSVTAKVKLTALQKILNALHDLAFQSSFGFENLSAAENKEKFAMILEDLAIYHNKFINLMLSASQVGEIGPENSASLIYDVAKSCYLIITSLQQQQSWEFVTPDESLMEMLYSHFTLYVNNIFKFCPTPNSIFAMKLQLATLLAEHSKFKYEMEKKLFSEYLHDLFESPLAKNYKKLLIDLISVELLKTNPESAIKIHKNALTLCDTTEEKIFLRFDFAEKIRLSKNSNLVGDAIETVLAALEECQTVDKSNLPIEVISYLLSYFSELNKTKIALSLFTAIVDVAKKSNNIRTLVNIMNFVVQQSVSEEFIAKYNTALGEYYIALVSAIVAVKITPLEDFYLLQDLDKLLLELQAKKIVPYANALVTLLLQRYLAGACPASITAIRIVAQDLLASLSSPDFKLTEIWSKVDLLFSLLPKRFIVSISLYQEEAKIIQVVIPALLGIYSRINIDPLLQKRCLELLALKNINKDIFDKFCTIHAELSNSRLQSEFAVDKMVEEFTTTETLDEEPAAKATSNKRHVSDKQMKSLESEEIEKDPAQSKKFKSHLIPGFYFSATLKKESETENKLSEPINSTVADMVIEYEKLKIDSTQQVLSMLGADKDKNLAVNTKEEELDEDEDEREEPGHIQGMDTFMEEEQHQSDDDEESIFNKKEKSELLKNFPVKKTKNFPKPGKKVGFLETVIGFDTLDEKTKITEDALKRFQMQSKL